MPKYIKSEWSFCTESELAVAVREITESAIRQIALPYFARFSSLAEILDLMLRPEGDMETSRLWFGNAFWSAQALAIAFLLGRRDVFDSLSAKFAEEFSAPGAKSDWEAARRCAKTTRMAEVLQERWDAEAGSMKDIDAARPRLSDWPPHSWFIPSPAPDSISTGNVTAGAPTKGQLVPAEEPPWIGGAIYVRVPEDTFRSFIRSVLVEPGGVLAGEQMKVMYNYSEATGDWVREREVKPASLKRLAEKIAQDGVSAALSDAPHSRDNSHSQRRAEWIIEPQPLDSLQDLHRLAFWMPRGALNQCAFIEFLRSIALHYDVLSGWASIGSFDCIRAVAQLSARVVDTDLMFRASKRTAARLNSMLDEMTFYASNADLISTYIPRAEWLLVLSQSHVESLGGEDRIREQSGCWRVERWGSSLLLQLTETPYDVTEAALAHLHDFLGPIRFPGAPEPIYSL